MNFEKQTAAYLLQSKAVKLQPNNPFTWASGWKSPIYCDNRVTLSFPEIRTFIRNAFAETVKAHFGVPELIAGVATGAIAQGALVADRMGISMAYVRSAPKGHGMENLIEGKVEKGQAVVVIEDLISTGGSSLKAVEALRSEGCNVLGMCAIFTYGFPIAEKAFADAGVKLVTLSNYNALIDEAVESGYVQKDQLEVLKKWREAPEKWGI